MIVGLLQVGINDTLSLGCAICSSQISSANGLSEYCASSTSSRPSLCRNWIYATWTSYSSIKLYELDVENFIIYIPSVVRPFELWILSFSDWQNRILNRGWKDSKCIFSHGSWFWVQLGKMIRYAALLRSTLIRFSS